jgi:ABC-type amino acid transport system permease subunit
LWGVESLRQLFVYSLWATILSFIGGVPLGILVTNMTFGEFWGGFPVFTDITDSKTSILIFYWIIFLVLIKGSAFKKDKTKNLLPDKILAWFGILGYILTLGIYLIPHSI